mgnify:CR=1 FL=1
MTNNRTVRELLCQAIENRRVVTFQYHWHFREVEPYYLGTHQEEQELMVRTFQIGGESESGGLPDWRLFRLGRITDLSVTDESFEPRRTQYEPNDPDLIDPVCQV